MNSPMSRRQILAVGTACSCSALLPSLQAYGAMQVAKLRQSVQQVAQSAVESGDIPGVVAQVWSHGELWVDVSAGWLDVSRKIPMSWNAIFGIASMTKPVTVALALRLLDEGVLRLSDPITRWVPEFLRMRVLRSPTGSLDDTVPAARDITVEDLMTHRSGLTYGFLAPPPLGTALIARVGMGIESAMTPDAWLKTLAEFPLAYQPGERFNYGHSIDVLGFLAARAAKTDLQTAMRQKLLAPLGMTDTGFWVPPEKRARLTPFYQSTQPTEFVAGKVNAFTADKPMAFASGGQGLLSTATDYVRFARMLLNEGSLDGTRVLKRDTVRLMRSNRFSEAERKLPLMPGVPFSQGFGLGMQVVVDDKTPGIVTGGVGTFGWPGAFGGWWQADPVEDMILIWLQECTPAAPKPGEPMPRLPGAEGTQLFRQAVYQSINS